jgi:tetratricopeptide (TPR) repeat protein
MISEHDCGGIKLSLPAQKQHPWIDKFLAAGSSVRTGLLDKLLSGIADISPYSRGLPHDVTVTLFRSTSNDAVLVLDETLAAWFAQRRAWTAERRRSYGLERFIGDMDQGLALLGAFKLPKSAAWLRKGFFDLMRWAGAISKEPAWRLDLSVARARAQTQDNSAMRHYWMRLSEEAASVEKRPLLDAAMLGLAGLPDREPGTIPTDVVTGLARWARRLPADMVGQTAFCKRLRAFKARYPAAGQTWRELWLNALERDRKGNPPPSYVEWLAILEPGLKKAKGQAVAFEPPSKSNLDELFALVKNGDIKEARRGVWSRIDHAEKYTRHSGDPYYLLMTATKFGTLLLDEAPSDALALAERALAWEPKHEHAWSIRARALRRLGHSGLAELVLWEAARRLPAAEAVRVDLAAIRANEGASAEAERLLRDASAHNPDVKHSTVELARLLAREGRLQEGISLLETFVPSHQDNPIALYTLAELRIAKGGDAHGLVKDYREKFGANTWYRTLERLIATGDNAKAEAMKIIRRRRDFLHETAGTAGPYDQSPLGPSDYRPVLPEAFERIGAAARAELLLRIGSDDARQSGRANLDKLLTQDEDDVLAHTAYALHDATHRQAVAGRLNDYPNALALRLAVVGKANGSIDWGALRRTHPDQIALIDLAYLVDVDVGDSGSRGRLDKFAASEAVPTSATPAAALVHAGVRRVGVAQAQIVGELRETLKGIVAAGALSAVEVDESVIPDQATA